MASRVVYAGVMRIRTTLMAVLTTAVAVAGDTGLDAGPQFDPDLERLASAIVVAYPDGFVFSHEHVHDKAHLEPNARRLRELVATQLGPACAADLERARAATTPFDLKSAALMARLREQGLGLASSNDGVVKADSYGAGYAGLIPGAKLQVIPEAGHLPHLEQPAAFMKALGGFVS